MLRHRVNWHDAWDVLFSIDDVKITTNIVDGVQYYHIATPYDGVTLRRDMFVNKLKEMLDD